MNESRQSQLTRLAHRVCAGEVVFFIGAGFSLDSEGNTASLLVARLLARFHGMSTVLDQAGRAEARPVAAKLRRHLVTTFSLQANDAENFSLDSALDSAGPDPTRLARTIQSLSQNYYLINDWMCSAFETLIAELAEETPDGFVTRASAEENLLLGKFSRGSRLKPIELRWYFDLLEYQRKQFRSERSVVGKALFLDTLGFENEEVMCGEPMAPRLADVVEHARRLRVRHNVLAWLAAEGLCPTLVTTNYDLLLDSAYRLAGLKPTEIAPGQGPPPDDTSVVLPENRRYRHFSRVAEATQFFNHGDAYESAVIHKIHGCVESYRRVRRGECFADLTQILRTIVFTFREIQNWREDSWSRDHLATLMRTRTIVFAGYSGADQVIHDTFRTVYEDVARHVATSPPANGQKGMEAKANGPAGAKARAFFADLSNAGSFHGIEILRSASLASADPSRDVTGHPNLLTYYRDGRFPSVDDTLQWLYHLCARELQEQALSTEVGRLAYQLFGRRASDGEAAQILDAFKLLRRKEREQAHTFDEGGLEAAPGVRRRFERMSRWTCSFSVSLLREYQLAELMLRHPVDALRIQKGAHYPWYRPLVEHPQWTAWGAVLELALRRALAAYVGRPEEWCEHSPAFEAIESDCPSILYWASRASRAGNAPAVRRALRIQLRTLRTCFAHEGARPLFAAREPVAWILQPETVPWWTAADDRRPSCTPAALDIWNWAAFDVEFSDLGSFFGESPA